MSLIFVYEKCPLQCPYTAPSKSSARLRVATFSVNSDRIICNHPKPPNSQSSCRMSLVSCSNRLDDQRPANPPPDCELAHLVYILIALSEITQTLPVFNLHVCRMSLVKCSNRSDDQRPENPPSDYRLKLR